MPDTMTMTKIVGAFCGALLIFLLASWAGEALYSTASHGEEEGAYVIETASSESEPGAEAADGPAFSELLASADVEKGAKVFGKCKACHKIEPGANATGPTLHAIVGRKVDSVPGYSYSGALEKVADVWGPDELNGFLEDPKGYAPGTKMGFSGLSKVDDRANLIAYLATLDG